MSLIDDFRATVAARNWPTPSDLEIPRGAIGWSAPTRDGDERILDHIIGVRELAAGAALQVEHIFDMPGAPRRYIRHECANAVSALDAIESEFAIAEDQLLALFGLKHDWGFPGAPVVPTNWDPDEGQRREILAEAERSGVLSSPDAFARAVQRAFR